MRSISWGEIGAPMFAWVRIIATSSIEGFNKFERGGSSFSAPPKPVEIQVRKSTTGTSKVDDDHSLRDGFNHESDFVPVAER